jgi:hypothetical protein
MKKFWLWILGLSILLILVVFVLFGTGLVSNRYSPMFWGEETERFWPGGYWGHHGGGMMRWGLPMMGIVGWLFALLLPISFVGLIVLVVILLVRVINPSGRTPSEQKILHCENCGKQVEPGWSVCPYCGSPLGGD